MALLTFRFNPHGQGQRETFEVVFVEKTETIHELLGRGLLLADDGLCQADHKAFRRRRLMISMVAWVMAYLG